MSQNRHHLIVRYSFFPDRAEMPVPAYSIIKPPRGARSGFRLIPFSLGRQQIGLCRNDSYPAFEDADVADEARLAFLAVERPVERRFGRDLQLFGLEHYEVVAAVILPSYAAKNRHGVERVDVLYEDHLELAVVELDAAGVEIEQSRDLGRVRNGAEIEIALERSLVVLDLQLRGLESREDGDRVYHEAVYHIGRVAEKILELLRRGVRQARGDAERHDVGVRPAVEDADVVGVHAACAVHRRDLRGRAGDTERIGEIVGRAAGYIDERDVRARLYDSVHDLVERSVAAAADDRVGRRSALLRDLGGVARALSEPDRYLVVFGLESGNDVFGHEPFAVHACLRVDYKSDLFHGHVLSVAGFIG